MNRQEFIERLRELLGDLSEEERQEAIQYYEDYFADAGEENEERVIEELGSPEKVALMIREGLQGEDGGSEYRETGYAQTRYEEREVPQSRHSNEEREQSRNQKPWTSRPLKILLIILIICVGFPVVVPVIGGIVFGALAILCAFFVIFSLLRGKKVSRTSSEEGMKTFGAYQGIKKLNIKVKSMNLYFQIDENLKEEMWVQGENLDDRTEVDIRQDKEELIVDSSSHKMLGRPADNTTSALRISLPRDFQFDKTCINVGSGSAYAEQILSRKMKVNVGSGTVKMDRFKAEEIGIDCGAGGVTMLGGNAPEKVLIRCGAGGVSVEFSGCSRQYDYDLDCSAGSISIDREEQIAGFGGKRKIDNNAQKKVKADCAAGGIELTFVQ